MERIFSNHSSADGQQTFLINISSKLWPIYKLLLSSVFQQCKLKIAAFVLFRMTTGEFSYAVFEIILR